MKAFFRNQWIAILAISISLGFAAWTAASDRQPVKVSEAISVLCESGVDGADGADGVDGADGTDGADGVDGVDGVDGAPGLQGICGPQGPQGLTGLQGEPGPAGSAGAAGERGPAGETGPRGEAGPAGLNAVVGVETAYELQGGTSLTQPLFDGEPMFLGSSVRNGELVYFRISVEFDNIVSFGTGQYFVTLPYTSKYDTTVRNGHLDRFSNGRKYAIVGHLSANSNVMTLWYTANTGQDEEFDHSHPYGLQVEDSFHIAGTYLTSD